MIFITGCTGLVGSHLVATLICKQQLESESISLSVNKSISSESESESESIVRVKLLCRKNSDLSLLNDVLKRYSFNEIPSNIEFVYHCAAVVSFDPSDKGSLMRVNVEGTRNMVNAALHCGVKKFCHVSSIAALGRALEGEPIDENSPWSLSKNNSIYSISKHEAEMEVWRGIAEGLNATIVNPSLILGAGRWNSSSCELFNVIAKGFPFYTTGINGFVDVKDVARAMIMLMENNKFGQRYCLNGALISYQYLFNLMAQNFNVRAPYIKVGKGLSEIAWRIFWLIGKIQGKKPLITKETARTATRKYSYSSEKIIRELNFKFTPIEESIKEICSIYKTR